MLHHTPLVTAGRLDPNPLYASFAQQLRQLPPAGQAVGDLPTPVSAMNCDVELSLDVSIPAVGMLVCAIFVDPAW